MNRIRCITTRLFWPFLLILMLFWTGCQEEQGEPSEMYYSYFPNKIGHFVIYNVDSVVYDDFTGQVLHYQYEVKELLESMIVDGEGGKSIRLERYIRQDEDSAWDIKNIWQARLLPKRAEKTEENITYIKLVFPPKEGSRWNGNAYNILPDQEYKITEAHNPYSSVSGFSFDSTVTVLQKEFFSLISDDFHQEIYAKGVGLIFKHFRQLNKEPDGTIVRGVDYTYQVKSYGQE